MVHGLSCDTSEICEFFASRNLKYCCCACVSHFSAIISYFRCYISPQQCGFSWFCFKKWNEMRKIGGEKKTIRRIKTLKWMKREQKKRKKKKKTKKTKEENIKTKQKFKKKTI